MNMFIQKPTQDLSRQSYLSMMALSDIDSQLKTLQAKKKKMQGELDAFKDEPSRRHGRERGSKN